MKRWTDIQNEIEKTKTKSKPFGNVDKVRRQKYELVSNITKRPLLVYATAFHNPIKAQVAAPFLSIDLSDKDGFDEIVCNLEAQEVDVFIHSPGGSAEATESIVKILRAKFNKVRFIVTGAAKSAATMLVLSGDSILMGRSAELGPIDPQVRVRGRFSPAGSIIEQFDRAAEELKEDPTQLPVWLPILQEFAPSLLVECENFIGLSRTLVTDWLSSYMFKEERDAHKKAERIANYLTDEKESLSHARRIGSEQLQEKGVKVELLENQKPKFRDAVRQLHLAIMTTLDQTDAVKIFENSQNDALIRNMRVEVKPPS